MKLRDCSLILFVFLTIPVVARVAEPHIIQMPQAAPPAEPEPPAPALALCDLEAIALERNPTLVQAKAAIVSSRGKALQAGLYPNPIVGYGAEEIGIEGSAGEFQGGFIQQTIVTGHKLRLSRAKYCQQTREAEIQALAQQLRVVNAVQVRFYELLAVQRMLEVRRRMLENAEESLRTHKEMFNTGQANQAEVLLAEVEVGRATIGLRTQQNHYRAAWENLVAVLGSPDMPPSPLAGELEPDGPPLDWGENLHRLLSDSPELHFAQAHVVHDQITVRREKAEPIPNILIQAGTGWSFETADQVTNVQVGVSLPIFDRNQGSVMQAQADLSRSIAEVKRLELSLRRRLAEVFNQYLTAHETAQIYREVTLPKTEQAHAIQLQMYKKRRTPWPDVVALERQVLAVQSEYTHVLLELRRAEVAIKGLLVVDGLLDPPGPVPGGHLEATPKPR